MRAGRAFPDGLDEQVAEALDRLEEQAGKTLGDADDPLLVSVRSRRARVDAGHARHGPQPRAQRRSRSRASPRRPGNERFAWDSYRRFVQMFGNVVRGRRRASSSRTRSRRSSRSAASSSTPSSTPTRCASSPTRSRASTRDREDFPQDPQEQLDGAIRAVFDSWMGERAVSYRRINRIPDDWGTAVNVQQMVFGNKGEHVGLRRRVQPRRGHRRARAVRRLPRQRPGRGRRLRRAQHAGHRRAARRRCPRRTRELMEILRTLERHYKDMQDTEFTVEEGRLYMLQTRNAKRPAQAAVRFAVDAVDEGLLDARGGAAHDRRRDARRAAAPDVRPGRRVRGARARASPRRRARRRATIVFTADDAVDARPRTGATSSSCARSPRPTTSPASTRRRASSRARAARPRHAALVARGMGVPCGDRRRRAGDRPRRPARSASRDTTLQRGRPDRDRRHDRARSRPTTSRSSSPRSASDFETVLEWADELAHARRARQRRHARGRAARRASSAPRASACAAPSTCSSARTASRRWSRVILGRRPSERRERAGRAAAAPAGATSRGCSRRWRACR